MRSVVIVLVLCVIITACRGSSTTGTVIYKVYSDNDATADINYRQIPYSADFVAQKGNKLPWEQTVTMALDFRNSLSIFVSANLPSAPHIHLTCEIWFNGNLVKQEKGDDNVFCLYNAVKHN